LAVKELSRCKRDLKTIIKLREAPRFVGGELTYLPAVRVSTKALTAAFHYEDKFPKLIV
jgi:hypothetical protein